MTKPSRFDRLRATRVALVQAFYHWQFSRVSHESVKRLFINHVLTWEDVVETSLDRRYFLDLLAIKDQYAEQIDGFLQQSIQDDWSLERMDPVLVAILMAGCCELLCPNRASPAPVVVSEYVEISKSFLGENTKAFVNKALDSYAHTLKLAMKKES